MGKTWRTIRPLRRLLELVGAATVLWALVGSSVTGVWASLRGIEPPAIAVLIALMAAAILVTGVALRILALKREEKSIQALGAGMALGVAHLPAKTHDEWIALLQSKDKHYEKVMLAEQEQSNTKQAELERQISAWKTRCNELEEQLQAQQKTISWSSEELKKTRQKLKAEEAARYNAAVLQPTNTKNVEQQNRELRAELQRKDNQLSHAYTIQSEYHALARLVSESSDEQEFFDLFCTSDMRMIPEKEETWLGIGAYNAAQQLVSDGILTKHDGGSGKERYCLPETTQRA